MTTFTIHNIDSAPEASKPNLEKAKKAFGMVPNLIGVLSESPVAVEAYQSMTGLFQASSFTPAERTVVWLETIFENNCEYCMAAHTGIAFSEKVDAEIVEALRNGAPLADARLQALREFTHKMVVDRGWVGEEALNAFLAAGFTKENVLEVVVGVAHKTISNYVNHIAATPVDAPFQKFLWKKGEVVAD